MKILVSIKNNLSQIRVIPSLGGTILSVLNKDLGTDYTATLMYKGWYYLSEIKGWAESSDIKINKILEPFDPETDTYTPEVITDDKKEDSKDKTYDIEKIINQINKSSTKINCTQVIYIEDGVEYPIYGMIKNVQQSLSEMQVVIKKVDKMPDIVKVDDQSVTEETNLLALAYDPKTKMYDWKNVSTHDLTDKVEESEYYTNEF